MIKTTQVAKMYLNGVVANDFNWSKYSLLRHRVSYLNDEVVLYCMMVFDFEEYKYYIPSSHTARAYCRD